MITCPSGAVPAICAPATAPGPITTSNVDTLGGIPPAPLPFSISVPRSSARSRERPAHHRAVAAALLHVDTWAIDGKRGNGQRAKVAGYSIQCGRCHVVTTWYV